MREAGSEVVLRGHVVRRERESFGAARVRVRATTVRAVPGLASRRGGLVQVRVARRRRRPSRRSATRSRPPGSLPLPSRAAEESGYAAYLRRAGVRVVLHAERAAARRVAGAAGSPGAIDAVRRRAERGVSAGLGDAQAALARGMVLGADEDIPERMAEDFKRSGLAHLLRSYPGAASIGAALR